MYHTELQDNCATKKLLKQVENKLNTFLSEGQKEFLIRAAGCRLLFH